MGVGSAPGGRAGSGGGGLGASGRGWAQVRGGKASQLEKGGCAILIAFNFRYLGRWPEGGATCMPGCLHLWPRLSAIHHPPTPTPLGRTTSAHPTNQPNPPLQPTHPPIHQDTIRPDRKPGPVASMRRAVSVSGEVAIWVGAASNTPNLR